MKTKERTDMKYFTRIVAMRYISILKINVYNEQVSESVIFVLRTKHIFQLISELNYFCIYADTDIFSWS